MKLRREVVERLLADMSTRVEWLRTYRGFAFEEFASDWRNLWAAEHGLHTAIQAAVDIGAHLWPPRARRAGANTGRFPHFSRRWGSSHETS